MSRTVQLNGLPVRDAKKAIILHVTSGDVKKGKLKDPAGCAAAVACLRQLGATEARVHVSRAYLRFNGKWERYETTPALRSEIVTFDRGGKFEPGEYRLNKVNTREIRMRGRAHSKRPAKHPRPYRFKRKHHILTNVRPMALDFKA